MSFYRELIEIEAKLISAEHEVMIPVSARKMKTTGDYDPAHFKGSHTNEERARNIRENFEGIAECESILVVNDEKNGVRGYIGPNVLMEIGIAFYLQKKIYVLRPYDEQAAYHEELSIFGVDVIDEELSRI